MEGTTFSRPFMGIPGVTTPEDALKAASSGASDQGVRGTNSADLTKEAKDMADAKEDSKEDAKAEAKDDAEEDENEDSKSKSKSKAKGKGTEADVKKGDVHIHLPNGKEDGIEDDSVDSGEDDEAKDDSSDDSKDDSEDGSDDNADDEEDSDDEAEAYARDFARGYAQALAEARGASKAAKADATKAFPPGKQAAPFGKDDAKEDAKDEAKEDSKEDSADAKGKAKAKAKDAAKSAIAKGALSVAEVISWAANASLEDKAKVQGAVGPTFDQGTGEGKSNPDPIVDLGGGVAPNTPSPKKLDLGIAGKDSAGVAGDGAPGFKAAVREEALDVLRKFVSSDEFSSALAEGREAKAAVKGVEETSKNKAAELDTKTDTMKAGLTADLGKALDRIQKLEEDQAKITKMKQPSKSVQSESLTPVTKGEELNKANGSAVSDVNELFKNAASPIPGVAIEAQEQLRQLAGKGETDLAQDMYRASTRR